MLVAGVVAVVVVQVHVAERRLRHGKPEPEQALDGRVTHIQGEAKPFQIQVARVGVAREPAERKVLDHHAYARLLLQIAQLLQGVAEGRCRGRVVDALTNV